MKRDNKTKIQIPTIHLLLKKFDGKDRDQRGLLCKLSLIVLFLGFSIIFARLFYLQIVCGNYYLKQSESNNIKKIRLQPYRGSILDRSGRLLAGVEPSFNIAIALGNKKGNLESTLARLIPLLDDSPTEIRTALLKHSDMEPYAPIIIKRNASWREVARVEARLYELPGVEVVVAPARKYPHGPVAPHLLGYLAEISKEQLKQDRFKNAEVGDLVGKSGIELEFEQKLAGKSGTKSIEVNAQQRLVRILKVTKPTPGENIQLTLDLDLQLAAEDALVGKSGAAVALDPRNGQILAMASSPKFDPTIFARGPTKQEWADLQNPLLAPLVNKAIQGQYAPGSTFKIVMAAAGLQEHVITPYTSFFCNGSFKLGRRRFRCWKRGGHGQTELYKAIVQSCDVYFYNVGLKLGVDKISKYAFAFGLGKKTGIRLPGEKAGKVPTRKWKLRVFKEPWQKGETLNYSIGQGYLLVTPLQLARMAAAVGNGGKLYRPQYLLKEPPHLQGRVPVDARLLALITKAMIGVVSDKHGTAKTCRIKGLEIAGKTGTAQVIKQSKRRESEKMAWRFRDHALFIAFAPAENPQIAVAVVIEHGGHGGSAAAPVARAILERWLQLQSPKPSTILQHNASVSNNRHHA